MPDFDVGEGGEKVVEGHGDWEVSGAGFGFALGEDAGGGADEVGTAGGFPEGQIAAGAVAADGAVGAVGEGTESAIDLLDELGKIEGEVAGEVGGPGVDEDEVVGGEECGDGLVAGRVGGAIKRK